MMAASYPTKKALKESIDQPLRYVETSIFGAEFRANGVLTVVGPAPYVRKWYARIVMKDGLIHKVT